MMKTKELIEHTHRELGQLQLEVQAARATIDKSRRLLSASKPRPKPR